MLVSSYHSCTLPNPENNALVARHSSERYSYVKVFLAVGLLLEALGLEFGLARLLTTYFMDLPNSRTQELEGTSSSQYC